MKSTGLKFMYLSELREDIKYLSKVACSVREENRGIFSSSASETRVNQAFITYIRNLDKNYDLTHIKGVYF